MARAGNSMCQANQCPVIQRAYLESMAYKDPIPFIKATLSDLETLIKKGCKRKIKKITLFLPL